MADDHIDEWTPEAMANYDAAHARLISTLDQFTAALRAALPTRTEGPELETLREPDDGQPVDPEEGAGLGVAVVWRFDLRVQSPSLVSARARALYAENYPEMG